MLSAKDSETLRRVIKAKFGKLIKVKGEDWWSLQHSMSYPNDTSTIIHQAFRVSDPDPKPLYLVVADEDK